MAARPGTDAGGLVGFNGYTGTLARGNRQPARGPIRVVAASHGFFVSTRLNLSSLAGQTVRFRWPNGARLRYLRLGAEWLDDVRVYSCAGAQIASVTPSSGAQGRTGLIVGITGQSTHALRQGVTIASFGAGITINGLTVTDSTHALMNISIAPTASLEPARSARHHWQRTGRRIQALYGGQRH